MGSYNGMRGRFIPENVLQGKRILGFKRRNFFEGIIMALIIAFFVSLVPFVSKVSWIITICLGLFVFLINAIGIRGQSLSQAFLHFMKYRKYTKSHSFRRLENARKETKPLIHNGKVRTISENKASENIKKIVRG